MDPDTRWLVEQAERIDDAGLRRSEEFEARLRRLAAPPEIIHKTKDDALIVPQEQTFATRRTDGHCVASQRNFGGIKNAMAMSYGSRPTSCVARHASVVYVLGHRRTYPKAVLLQRLSKRAAWFSGPPPGSCSALGFEVVEHGTATS